LQDFLIAALLALGIAAVWIGVSVFLSLRRHRRRVMAWAENTALENVPAETVERILADLTAAGWERVPDDDGGRVVLRSGENMLLFRWGGETIGAVKGPALLLKGIADRYGLRFDLED
jgi:hypothetical protein